jgi:hypothetical protein
MVASGFQVCFSRRRRKKGVKLTAASGTAVLGQGIPIGNHLWCSYERRYKPRSKNEGEGTDVVD